MEEIKPTIQEPEEKKQYIDADYNPLDEPVNEKTYSQPNIGASAEDIKNPIPEPSFTPPPFTKAAPPKIEPKREPINPEMKQLSKKDTEMASAHMAKMIMQGYEWAHTLANNGLKVSEKKLHKLQAQGDMNLNAMIDYEYGKQIRAGDFFEEYNNQTKDLLKVTDEFKEEVTPVLERVLAKRGIGLTDEQLLMFMFGKDIATKSVLFFQQKAQVNSMIQSIREATTSQFAQQAPRQQPQPQPVKQPETPEQPKTTEPTFTPPPPITGVKPDAIVPKRGGGRAKF